MSGSTVNASTPPDGRCGARQEAAYSLSRDSQQGDYVRRRLVPL
jgi:hypothetical protein